MNYDLFKSVININERMTYTNVNKILVDNDPEQIERYGDLVDDFRLMKELADILRQERMGRGALDFSFPETKVIVDEKGYPIDIQAGSRESGNDNRGLYDQSQRTVAEAPALAGSAFFVPGT